MLRLNNHFLHNQGLISLVLNLHVLVVQIFVLTIVTDSHKLFCGFVLAFLASVLGTDYFFAKLAE